ncbi:MAG TPA: T9SS type A sorting domain-containing protein [Chitinophagaceae bacterium]
MRKFYLPLLCAVACTFCILSCKQPTHPEEAVAPPPSKKEKKEGYDGPAERDQLEFEKTKDPALGYVPYDRLMTAIEYTEDQKKANVNRTSALLWVERGPIYDSVGPSNGNTRGGGGFTAGRIRAVLVDTLNDPSGNTVICGGVSGGLWRCTNFLSGVPNWQPVNDFFDNLAIASVCQDPSNPAVMYFATGEATSNADAVFGKGIWKSTNAGISWTQLPSTGNFIRNFKILCDASGNVYVAARTTTTPAVQSAGLLRSKDGGSTWENITPTGLTSNSTCTDIELSSTGRLHASFGYVGTIVNHRYADNPANVTSAGWTTSTGIRTGAPDARRMELACRGDILYAVTVNSANNVDSCYKSVDGGNTWTKQNAAAFPSGLGSGQGWYNLTLAINPLNTSEIMIGGLDAYRSVNDGQTVSRVTYWVTTIPYVHADHHFMQWWTVGGENRILIGCDGGLFLSRDNGTTWVDKNRNLAIKQFYACAIHPDAGSNYLLAGAQDNGSHQLKNPGLSYSIEVTGGDGCFVHINQQNPQIQFTSYVYNQYRRSVNGGQSWSSVNLSTQGSFVNPFDYDDAQNIMYAGNGANAFRRWPNANTANVSEVLTTTELGGGNSSAFKVSPYTPNRVFIGSSNGRLIRLDNANTVTAATIAANVTNIRGAAFSTGNINCINTGTSDDHLVAVFSNYGVNNVWYTSDGGTNWSAIDGNLPDMPVRWAVFEPGTNTKLILGTEAGVYTTDNINGATTVWAPDPAFPTVRTTMLKVRTSDNTIAASTHGRGMFTATIPATVAPEIRFVSTSTSLVEESVGTTNCRSYKDISISVGLINAATGDATVTYNVQAAGTATQGPDFDFTTNGNFTNPSNQHLFLSGTTGAKTINLRVYDDAEVESAESFTITFSISGATNAIAGAANTHVVTVTDNDEAPFGPGNLTASFGLANTSLTQPFRGQFSDSRTQIVYLASELRTAGFRAGNITSLGFNVTAKNSTAPFENYTIKLKNTTRSTATGGAFETGASTVYGPVSYSTVSGANNFALTTPFYWDGTSNLLIDICYDNAAGTATDNVAGTSGLALCHFERVDNAAGCSIVNAGFVFSGGARPDMNFSISTTGTVIASALNSSQSSYLHSGNDLYYYNTAGELMARVKNLSNHNYGCTDVSIDRAGSGAAQFWNTTPANYMMEKTYRINPATNNSNGRYEVTLYFTKAEKEGWEAATGQSWNNIQLVKLPSAVKNVSPQNPQPDGAGTIQIVTPIRGTFGEGFTLSYTFDNGFSAFGAGIPGRINTQLDLNGKIENGKIVLDWTTAAEMGSTTFEVDKSYDRINFRKIGSVQAAGTKFTSSSYALTDPEVVQYNYYRVRMMHADGYMLTSDTILVKNDNIPQQLIVLTNPFNGSIRVRFARIPGGTVVFTLYDAAGKLIRRTQSPGGQVLFNIGTQHAVSKGIYVLDAFVDGKHYTVRLMKQ